MVDNLSPEQKFVDQHIEAFGEDGREAAAVMQKAFADEHYLKAKALLEKNPTAQLAIVDIVGGQIFEVLTASGGERKVEEGDKAKLHFAVKREVPLSSLKEVAELLQTATINAIEGPNH